MTATNFKTNPSIIVIGAGPVGLYTASVLAKAGCHVRIIDDGRRGAGWASGGMLGASYEMIGDADAPDAVKTFARDSQKMWSTFLSSRNAAYVKSSLFIARSAQEIVRLTQLSNIAAEFSAHVEPCALPLSICGLRAWTCQNDIAFDPRKMLALLAHECTANNVLIQPGTAKEVETGKVTLRDGTVLMADIIIVATGQAGSELADNVPELANLALVKGQMLAIGGSGVALDRVVRAGRIYLIPRDDLVVVGATSNPNDTDIGRFDHASHRGLLDEATLLCPALRQGQVVESWTGLRPMTSDALPMVGHSQQQGVLIATGTYRNGWLFSAGIASALLGLVLGEDLSPAKLQLFAPNRFPT